MDTMNRVMQEFFNTNSVEEIDWVKDSRDQKKHGLYLVAMWTGMEKPRAYEWIDEHEI